MNAMDAEQVIARYLESGEKLLWTGVVSVRLSSARVMCCSFHSVCCGTVSHSHRLRNKVAFRQN